MVPVSGKEPQAKRATAILHLLKAIDESNGGVGTENSVTGG
jgi:hypothetical protein